MTALHLIKTLPQQCYQLTSRQQLRRVFQQLLPLQNHLIMLRMNLESPRLMFRRCFVSVNCDKRKESD
ncbi:unnamed protein product [Anisakis simplex]|uniref:Uncharacterized protein n=1 Tax=Anisakis simplex TaxID=6269 RepID=A0A0M3KF61_ANISI|nr:unnamed protein product [Anisakis simplex]